MRRIRDEMAAKLRRERTARRRAKPIMIENKAIISDGSHPVVRRRRGPR